LDKQLPNRKTIRLKHYDYALAGAYFVTICAADKRCIFGKIVGEAMELNNLGRIVENCWQQIPKHSENAELDEFVIMPNHLHGIIILHENNSCRGAACSARNSGAHRDTTCSTSETVPSRGAACSARPEFSIMRSGTLSTIVRSFKSAASKITREKNLIGFQPLWQRNFFERIIRDDDALMKAREYVVNNPLRWHLDKENPDRNN